MHKLGICALLPALWLGGCAIHPLPEDVTGNTTYLIVQKLRCEARDALTALAVRALRESYNTRTLALADRLEAGDLNLTQMYQDPKHYRDFDPNLHDNFEIFSLSALAFDFTFAITENNDATAGANFRYPFAEGVFNLSVSGGSARERQNERKLKAGHTFYELYELTNPEICRQIDSGGGNLIYPMTGRIGLGEVINTFYLLNRPYNPNLRPPVDKYGPVTEAYQNRPDGGDIRDLTDTLMFTTTFNAGATPSITLNPITSQVFRLADATATASAKRSDVHKVAISLVMGARPKSLAQARGLAGLRRVTAPGALGAKQRAWQRLDELRTEDFFTRNREISRRLGLPPQ
jgi:hypothetical protein